MEKARRKAVLNCDMFEKPHAKATCVTDTSGREGVSSN